MNKKELIEAFNKLQILSNNCHHCDNCDYCHNCDYSKNCILCKGLSNKTNGYWLLNKEVSKEEFEQAKRELLGE